MKIIINSYIIIISAGHGVHLPHLQLLLQPHPKSSINTSPTLSHTHIDLVEAEVQLHQTVQALEDTVMHEGDVVLVDVQLGQVCKYMSVDHDVLYTKRERVN